MHGVMMLQARGITMYNATDARPRTKIAYDTRADVQARASGHMKNDAPKLRVREIRKRRRNGPFHRYISDIYFGVMGNVGSEGAYRARISLQD